MVCLRYALAGRALGALLGPMFGALVVMFLARRALFRFNLRHRRGYGRRFRLGRNLRLRFGNWFWFWFWFWLWFWF